MGLLVSAAIYFIVMWPQVEPDPDEVVAAADDPGAAADDALSSDP
jgi:hypothetical protein